MTGKRQTDVHLEAVRQELATALKEMFVFEADRKKVSHLIARFSAQAVRADRVHRHPHDALIKLVDVFFNGRPA